METQSCPINARPKRQSRHSSMRMRMADGFEHFQLAGFNDGDGLRTFNRRKSSQKIFNGFAAYKGVNQILQGDTRADKNGRAAHDFRVGVDDAFQIFHCHIGICIGQVTESLPPTNPANLNPCASKRKKEMPKQSLMWEDAIRMVGRLGKLSVTCPMQIP